MLQHNLTAAQSELDAHNARQLAQGLPPMRYFIPMGYRLVTRGNQATRVKRPLMPGYVFLNSTEPLINEYKRSHPSMYYYVPTVRGVRTTKLIVPDVQMNSFITVAQSYDQDVPYVQLDEVTLVPGDQIRIIGGPLDGVEGTLITTQGKQGGKVMVQIPGVMSVTSWHIEPQYIQILRFATGTKRLYDTFDAFLPRAQKAFNTFRLTGNVTDADQTLCATFLRRMEHLQTDSLNAEAKLLASLFICRTLLRHDISPDPGLVRAHATLQSALRALLPRLTSPRSRTLILSLLPD